MTEWRFIPGFEGLYQVSEHGDVRSVDRTVVGKDDKARRFSGMALRPYKNNAGYLCLRLSRRSPQMVHTLVAAAFIGPRPVGSYVCHEDGDRLNNTRRNLRYDTPAGNQADRISHGTLTRGSALPQAKLTEKDIPAIRARIKQGHTHKRIAEDYGVVPPTISLIASGKNWKHVR